MTITTKKANDKIYVILSGRLDMATAQSLHDALTPALEEAGDIILDFDDVAYVSSAGLRILLLAQKSASAKGKTMTLRDVPPEIMEVFEMTGFVDVLTFG